MGLSFLQAVEKCTQEGYSEKYKDEHPTYKDVYACEEWLTFSTFKAWMETQDHEGLELDKDVLIRGNKLYSPKTCVFVSTQVNKFLSECSASRGMWMIGVSWCKSTSKFKAECSNPFSKKADYLGCFISEQDAHNAWLKRKLELAHELAAIQTDERIAKALINRYENY